MIHPTKENGRVATQPNSNHQKTQRDFTDAELREQAIDSAAHLKAIPRFEGITGKASVGQDIRSLFKVQSAAPDPQRARPKLEGRAIMLAATPSIADRKGFKPDLMALLAVDFDKGNLSLHAVQTLAQGYFGASTIAAAYSTASSAPNARRWRLLVPLATPIKPELWLRILRGFARYLAAGGLEVDVTAERVTQLHFLPNVPPDMRDSITGAPLHFEHHFWGNELLDPQRLTQAARTALAALDEQDKAVEAQRLQQAAEAARKKAERDAFRQQQLAAGGDGLSVIERFNLAHPITDLMLQIGYEEDPTKPHNWRSPLQTSGSYATQVREDDSWYSLSGSDKAAGLGTPQAGGVGGDAFDLFTFFKHDGDRKAAVKDAARMLGMPPPAAAPNLGAFKGVDLPAVPNPSELLTAGGVLTVEKKRSKDFEHTGDGKGFSASRSNLEKALLADDFCHRVGFDAFKCEVMICEPDDTVWRPLRDTDIFNISVCLERKGFKTINKETVRDAVGSVAERNTFDSATQWLNSLKWDGVPRVSEFLERGFGSLSSPYHQAIGRYIFTALAGRILSPGEKADMVPVAVGPQGCRKSSAVLAMAPKPELFGEMDLSLKEPDLFRGMKGKLVLELGELAGMYKKEIEHLKRFVAARNNEWVEKWRIDTTIYQRRSLFFGTTNDASFLSDTTGNRRWLPFEAGLTGKCDPDWIAKNRDQLFVEGAHLYSQHGVMFEEAERLARDVHGDFAATDPWDDILYAWANRPALDGTVPSSGHITITDALQTGLGLSTAQINRGAEMRAGASLRRLGFKREQRRIGGRRCWVYAKE